MEAAAIDTHVSYEWAGDWGLLAETTGVDKYLESTAQTYIQPERSPQNHAGVFVRNPSATRVRIMTASIDQLKEDYATLLGFRKEVGQNFRKALSKKYWEQLEEPVFLYKNIMPQDYVVHLDT